MFVGCNNKSINEHEYVDLGLPSGTKWATCNVGANSPEEYGNYYAWGETLPKITYTEDNSKTHGKNIGDISGNESYDAATANWGSDWRMPTYVEMKELVEKCSWTWTTVNDISGFKVTGPNGNSIFLPSAGLVSDNPTPEGINSDCYYLTSTPYEGLDNCCAYRILYCLGVSDGLNGGGREYGFSVRPVFGTINTDVQSNNIYPSYLKGVWFTPHAATHKISFNSNMHFSEIDYDDKIIKGRYTINDSVITLYGEDGSQKEGIIKVIDDEYYIDGYSIGWMVKGGSYTEEEFENRLNQFNNAKNIDEVLKGYWVFEGRVDGMNMHSEIEINSEQMVWVVNNNLQYRGTWMYDANLGCIFFNYGSGGYKDLFEFDMNLGIKMADGKYHKKQSNNYRSNSNQSSQYIQRSSSYSDWTFRTDMDVYNYLASNKFVGEGYTLTFSDGGMVMCTNGNPVTNPMRVERFNEYRAVLSYTSPYIPGSHTIVIDNKNGTINDNGDIYRIR